MQFFMSAPQVHVSPVEYLTANAVPFIGIIVTGFALLTAGWVFVIERRDSAAMKRVQVIGDRLRSESEEATKGLSEADSIAFSKLWQEVQDRIGGYHEIATTQSRNSFTGTQFATYSGFGLVMVLGIIAAFAPTSAGSITVAAVAAVASALSAYVGTTFMKSQAQSTAQLQQFFLQPMEIARLLIVERLMETLSEQDRSAAVLAVINRMAFAAGDHNPTDK